MMRLEFGCCPPKEEHTVSIKDAPGMRRQARAWARQLTRAASQALVEAGRLRFRLSVFQHDFGAYTEVVGLADDDDGEAVAELFRLEAEGPTDWDDEARAELTRPAPDQIPVVVVRRGGEVVTDKASA